MNIRPGEPLHDPALKIGWHEAVIVCEEDDFPSRSG
jgi:hypothetical protein